MTATGRFWMTYLCGYLAVIALLINQLP